jgi:uracil-DNA glycosylase family 4
LIYVPGTGPSSAKLAVIGEFPNRDEEAQGLPFVGSTGKMVDSMLVSGGSSRGEVYLSNVSKVRPPGNDIGRLKELGTSLEDQIPQLVEELRVLRPNAILALGNTALRALTYETGIKKWRGSILPCKIADCKVIPTIHPAAILHGESEDKGTWKDLTYIQWDFNRAICEARSRELDLPRRNLIVCKSSLDLFRFLDRNQDKKLVSVDIETFRTIPICIGFAFNSYEAMSIPLFNIQGPLNEAGIGRSDMLHIWKTVADLLANPQIQKIGQNFKFDESLLTLCYDRKVNFGMVTRGFFFDTHLAFRTLYPELPGKLEFISSVLTKEPYYKDEGKEFNPKRDKLDRLLLYNAKDAVVTFECYEAELRELRDRNLNDFFFERVMPLHPFYSHVEGRGILRDDNAKEALDNKYAAKEESLRAELLELTDGLEVNVMSNGTRGQVAKLLFGVWNLPLRQSTDEKTLSALMRNAVKDARKKRGIEVILELRKVRKIRGTYINAEPSGDGKLRTGYRIMLETGRTSTSILKPPITTTPMGLAFQTISKHGDVGSDLRSMFIPAPRFVFLEPDLSQAEDRVVAILSNDLDALKIYEYKIDRHRVTAGWLYDKCPDDLLRAFFLNPSRETADEISRLLKIAISEEERQMGKKFRHAGNYDMGKRTASENVGVSEYRAGKDLDKFHTSNPKIRGVFHAGVIEALNNNNRMLRNPFGRERQFLNKWGHELFKEAYAQIPQSTVSDQLKFAAIRIEKRAPWLEILQESHDSFLAQCPIALVDRSLPIIKEELEQPINFKKCSLSRDVDLVIPCEIKMGEKNWEAMRRVL